MLVLSNNKKIIFIFITLILAFIFLFFFSLSIGPIQIPFRKVLENLFHYSDTLEYRIIFDTRLPRSLTACLVGISLGLAGMNLQLISQNPMACPSLLGINQGAGLGIVIILAFFPFCHPTLFLTCAIMGGLLATALIYFIANKTEISPLKFILAGQAINALFYAIIQGILVFLPTRSGVILINLNGSLAGSSWELLKWTFVPLILAIFFNCLSLKQLHILALGKNTSSAIGLNYNYSIIFFLIISLILSSLSVALIGPILFLPLIINHFSKICVGNNPYILAPFVGVFGASFILLCDSVMKMIFIEKELAIGLLIAIIGAPILILTSKIRNKNCNV